VFTFAGENRLGYNSANITGTCNAAGQGGRFDGDGESAVGFFWGPFTDAGEVEDMDNRLPHFVLSRKIDRNNHGYGKYRGGASLVEVSTACGDQGCLLNSWGSADKISHNPGIMGGYMGPPNPRVVIQGSDFFDKVRNGEEVNLDLHELITEQKLSGDYRLESSGQPTEQFSEGDIMIFSMGGGGGYGDVLERPTELVAKDLKEGMITSIVAESVYGVVLVDGTDQIDLSATENRRNKFRRTRLKEGKTFDEFIKVWSKKKPVQNIIEYYGDWPEPRAPGYNKPFWGLLV